MSIENSQTHESNETLSLTELPQEIKENAIADLEKSLSEEYNEPTTNLEKVKEVLYQSEENNSLDLKLDTIFIAYWPLWWKLTNDDFGYPPGNTSVEELKELINSTNNPFMESQCWELLKQHDELNKLRGKGEDIGYQDFIQEYNKNFDLEDTEIIPINFFSRRLSKTIINSVNPEDRGLVNKLAKYTENETTLLHPKVLNKIENDEEKAKALAICHKDTFWKNQLESPKEEIIKKQLPVDVLIETTDPEETRNQLEDLIEETAKKLLPHIDKPLNYS